jgi:hypothetical protein
VAIDYRSFDPSLDLTLPVADWIDKIRRLEGFDATQHLRTNHVHTVSGDRARCVSYMQAGHFLARDGITHACFLYGHYTNDLVRTGSGWKIEKCALTITARTGENRVFDWVFGAA